MKKAKTKVPAAKLCPLCQDTLGQGSAEIAVGPIFVRICDSCAGGIGGILHFVNRFVGPRRKRS